MTHHLQLSVVLLCDQKYATETENSTHDERKLKYLYDALQDDNQKWLSDG